MAFASSAGKLFTSTRAGASFRCETRQMSNLLLAKGSISTLFQAKGRTDEALLEAAATLSRKKVPPLALNRRALSASFDCAFHTTGYGGKIISKYGQHRATSVR